MNYTVIIQQLYDKAVLNLSVIFPCYYE